MTPNYWSIAQGMINKMTRCSLVCDPAFCILGMLGSFLVCCLYIIVLNFVFVVMLAFVIMWLSLCSRFWLSFCYAQYLSILGLVLLSRL